MFYCNDCAKKNGYPETVFKSDGKCECCEKVRPCNEMKSSLLPKPAKDKILTVGDFYDENYDAHDFYTYVRGTAVVSPKKVQKAMYDYLAHVIKNTINNEWISTKDRLPKAGEKVLIVRDVRPWDKKRKPHVDIANVHFSKKQSSFGGPNSLTGSGYLQGIYFSVPAILNPDSVTYWQPLPDISNCLSNF